MFSGQTQKERKFSSFGGALPNCPQKNSNSWFQERGFASNHHDFDKVYVNGDNLLGTLRRRV